MESVEEIASEGAKGSLSRNWFLTVNNPTTNTLPQLPNERFAIWQKEVGESGTPHLQATIVFPSKVAFSTMKKTYPTAWIGHVKSLPAAINYCRKEDTRVDGPWTRGEEPRQGKRTDIERCIELVVDNLGAKRPFKAAAMTMPSTLAKYHKGIEFVATQLIPDREEVPEVHVYFGKTGKGKTRHAKAWLPDAWEWGPAMKQWFTGYLGQQEAIFDEFRGQIPYAELLMILDRYTCSREIKGGMVSFVASKIAITSPVPPVMWYPRQCEKTDSVDQLMRRITKVFHCVDNDLPPVEVDHYCVI